MVSRVAPPPSRALCVACDGHKPAALDGGGSATLSGQRVKRQADGLPARRRAPPHPSPTLRTRPSCQGWLNCSRSDVQLPVATLTRKEVEVDERPLGQLRLWRDDLSRLPVAQVSSKAKSYLLDLIRNIGRNGLGKLPLVIEVRNITLAALFGVEFQSRSPIDKKIDQFPAC